LQIQLHLILSLEAGYQTGETPITEDLVESVLSRQLDDLEPTLTRHGYRVKDLVEQFNVKPAEIKALFSNSLDAGTTLPVSGSGSAYLRILSLNFIFNKYEPTDMECKPVPINASSFADNLSPARFSVAINLSPKLR
ncbi:MAG: hypothetical protein Q7U43_10700, partial [Methylococcaceae bacterium]|nr:hypothetical protein [Methylococcaceae bacterium]MDP2391714.1 hypothetical protein [Methylococcaceae bacterium]